MARQVYLQGGPKDGELVTVGDDWVAVDWSELPPTHILAGEPLDSRYLRVYRYRPRGRRTLQGIEVFECGVSQ